MMFTVGLVLAALQHAASQVQKVQVVAPVELRRAAADTIQRVRLVGPVEIVPHGIDLSGWIMAIATVVLVWVTIRSDRRTDTLNAEVAQLQKDREKDRIRSVGARARRRLRVAAPAPVLAR
jgi:hypothetical protein